jgi:NAD+ diphosphatase
VSATTDPSEADRALLGALSLSRGTVDKAAHYRQDESWLRQRWADERTRVLAVNNSRAPARFVDGVPRLYLVAPTDISSEASRVFLGIEDGVAFFAVLTENLDLPIGVEWADLRVVGAQLDDRDAGLMVTAVGLDHWHRAHPMCARCGSATDLASAGWVRRCPHDGFEHYPRTDPAVIVLVRDEDDRALLGRQARWEKGWFSTLAGFVEPGESAEDAVRREVAEESGVRVGEVVFLGSQPWPFPSSLMFGYHAWATDSSIEVDGTEIEEARWFSRDELAAACREGSVSLPPAVSIARRLIERWYGADLPGDWSRPIQIPR